MKRNNTTKEKEIREWAESNLKGEFELPDDFHEEVRIVFSKMFPTILQDVKKHLGEDEEKKLFIELVLEGKLAKELLIFFSCGYLYGFTRANKK